MIRQAISCDICGAEKKQTNHWFVAWETAGELRISGWNSRNRLRAGSSHLCGQVCLHKLADDFMARVIASKTDAKAQAAIVDEAFEETQSFADTSLTSPSSHQEIESSVRLIPSAPRPQLRAAVPLVLPEPPRVTIRNRRAEAWERERERTQQPGDGHRPAIISRRISQA